MSTRCILGCPTNRRSKISHRFPNPWKFPKQYEAWLSVLPEDVDKEKFNYRKHRICHNHFLQKDKLNFKSLNNRIIQLPVLCLPGQLNEEVTRKTIEDEHNYASATTEYKKTTLPNLEKEDDCYSKPLEKDITIDYMQDSGNATSTCIKLLDRNNDFGKILTQGKDVSNIINSLAETQNNGDTDQPLLRDADNIVGIAENSGAEIKHNKPHKQTKQKRILTQGKDVLHIINSLAETQNNGDTDQPLLCDADNIVGMAENSGAEIKQDKPNKQTKQKRILTQRKDVSNIINSLAETQNNGDTDQPLLRDADNIVGMAENSGAEIKQNKPHKQTKQKRILTQGKDVSNIMNSLAVTQNNSDTDQPLLRDADNIVGMAENSGAEIKQNKPHKQTKQKRKTVHTTINNHSSNKNISSRCQLYVAFIGGTNISEQNNLCMTDTNSDKLFYLIANDLQINVTDQIQSTLSDANEAKVAKNISSMKPIQYTKLMPKLKNIAPYKPSPTPDHSDTLLKSECKVLHLNSKRQAVTYTLLILQNNSTTSTKPNLCIKDKNSDKFCISNDLESNVTDKVPFVSSDANESRLAENISGTKRIQNTKLLLKSQNIALYKPSPTTDHSDTLLKSRYKVLNPNSKRHEFTFLRNNSTSTKANLCMKETNSDKLCISNDLKSNVTVQVPLLLSNANESRVAENISSTKPIQNTKLLPKIQNIAPYKPSLTPAHSATLLKSKCEVYNDNSKRYKIVYVPVPNNSTTSTIPNLCIKETNSDKLCITNVTDQVPLLLSDANEFSLTENISSTKPIHNTKLLPKLQNIAPYKPSLTPAHSATLLKSKYKIFNADSKRHASISMQNNSKEISHSDKVCILDDDSRTATDQPPTFSCADARDTENTSSAEMNSDTLIPVRMYNEQNSIPGSTKRAKLDLSELSEYTIVGSTTIITGMYVPEDQQLPLEDPLAIHISGLGINDSVSYLEGSVYSEENSIRATEDSMSYDEDNTSVDDVSSHLGYSIKSNDSIAHLEDYELDASILNNEDDFKDSMSYDEDNTSVDDVIIHLGDSIKSNDSNAHLEDYELDASVLNKEDDFRESMSYDEDNTSVGDVSSYIGDSIKSNDSNAHLEDYELDGSVLNNEDDVECRVEIAFALKFIFHQGKTAIDAVKDIIDTYGPGKMSLKEAECWYKEFKLGNDDVIRIISSGGPVYK